MTDRRLDVLVVRWYERTARSPDVVARWLAAAREHLPEAVPRRYGDTEPLRGRFGRDGDQGLAEGYARAGTLLFLRGAPPVWHASLAGAGHGPVRAHSLQAGLDPADERVHRFALALTHRDTVYVSASVARGMVLDGSTLYGPAEDPEEPCLAPRGDWLGLPPGPPAWCWFGPAYARRVARHVAAEPIAGGLWFSGGTWVPEPLRARLHEPDPARRHAPRGPRGLRRSPLRFR